MEWAALVTWVLTAGGGLVMLAIWLKHGGVAGGQDGRWRIRPAQLFPHFGLAAVGLVVWLVYLATDEDVLAWIALAVLAGVALLGFSMFAVWFRARRERSVEPPEQRFPVPIVALHGLLGATTLVLVLLTALGVGES